MIITLSEITNFLWVITFKTFFKSGTAIFFWWDAGYLDSCIFVFLLAYAPNILTSFWGFLSSKQPDLLVLGGVDVESTCIKIFKDICGKFPYIGDASIGDTCHRDVCISNTSTKRTCSSIIAIELLEINLQSFLILKVKLFSTWLDIEVDACWLYLCLFCMLSRPIFIAIIFKMRDVGVEIWVRVDWNWYLVF